METIVPVKRACVSAAAEILREQIPAIAVGYQEKHRVPSCKQCQRERTKSQDFRSRQKGKRKQNRANTPIVIQLKDTIKAAIQQKQRNKKVPLHKQDSGDSKDDADVETDNSSDRGDLDIHVRDNQQRKNAKNLSAFIDVMEKAHQKEMIVNLKGNLRMDNTSNEKLVAEYVLNNVSPSQNLRRNCGKRSIADCENIDVICNDLTSVESTVDDTEESEISSTTSSSEIQSDSDISNPQESPAAVHEFTTEELQKLAEYTTGCPLIRYDCAPASCPQCQWYTSHSQLHTPPYDAHKHTANIAQSKHPYKSQYTYSGHATKHSKFAHQSQHVPFSQKTVSVTVGDSLPSSDSDAEDLPSESSLDLDAPVYEPAQTRKGTRGWHTQKQLLDIDIAGKPHKPHLGDPPDVYLDSVYIDLTDTDVSFSVYYHHDLNETQTAQCAASYASYCSSSHTVSGPHHHGDFSVPYFSMPYYHQYLYCSVYCPPFYNLPMPFCLQPEDSLPKTAMVPPEELANCKSNRETTAIITCPIFT